MVLEGCRVQEVRRGDAVAVSVTLGYGHGRFSLVASPCSVQSEAGGTGRCATGRTAES